MMDWRAILAIATVLTAFPCRAGEPAITRFDLMTDVDAVLLEHLNPDPLLQDVADWPIVNEILGVSRDLIDAAEVAATLERVVPVNKQPAFAWVTDIVRECAEQLDVQPPVLAIDNQSEVNAYVTRLQEPHILVLTSDLYELFKNRPDELRFIIGHELGHLKCNHLRCHLVGRSLVGAICGVSGHVDRIDEGLVTPLLVAALLKWYRESEISADRAGLLCVNGDIATAKQALWRLKHGTNEEFDTNIAQAEVRSFEGKRFVETIRWLRGLGTTHPFVEDRCTAVDRWGKSPEFRYLLARSRASSRARSAEQVVRIEQILVEKLPDADTLFNVAPDPVLTIALGESRFTFQAPDNSNSFRLSPRDWMATVPIHVPIIVSVSDSDDLNGADRLGASCLRLSPACGFDAGIVTTELSELCDVKADDGTMPRVTIRYRTATRVSMESSDVAKMVLSLQAAQNRLHAGVNPENVMQAQMTLRKRVGRFLVELNESYPGLDCRPPSVATDLSNGTNDELLQWKTRIDRCEELLRKSMEKAKFDRLSFGQSHSDSLLVEIEALP